MHKLKVDHGDIYNKLNTKTMDELLEVFESGMKASAFCYVVAMKAASEIENSGRWLNKESYSSELLKIFAKAGISEPWALTFRDWVIALYPHFSYVNYVKVASIISKIPYELAERLTEDALQELSKYGNRERISRFIPLIEKTKDPVVRKAHIMIMADEITSKEKPIPIKEVRRRVSMTPEEKNAGKIAGVGLQNKRLQKEILVYKTEIRKRDSLIANLENQLKDKKDEVLELQGQLKDYKLEINRYKKR